ncbi:NAD(P)H-dependent oxidoreductase [Rhodobacteraceae bacterium F11138]|nr:NAD(P)H-dependent oxidoreductase [Rhodobacteraceae bacterium F11138]
MTATDFLEALRWRYATKQFDATRAVPENVLAQIVEATRLSPSSVNLQPYKLILLTERAQMDALIPATWLPNRPKLETCGALGVLTVPTDLGDHTVENFLDQVAADKGIPRESLAEVEAKAKGFLMGMSPEARIEWARRQAFLALGTLLSACAAARIDSCPMEGFVPEDYDRVLGLSEQRLTTAVLVALGYRDASDPAAAMPKYRRSISASANGN